MDLAKIRKKLKDSGKKSGGRGDKSEEERKPEEVALPEASPEAAIEEVAREGQPAPDVLKEEEIPEPVAEEPPEAETPEGPEMETVFEPAKEETEEVEDSPVERPAGAGFEGGEPPKEVGEKAARHEEGEGERKRAEVSEFLAFRLSSEVYAFRIGEVEEIVRPQKVTFVPRADECLIGVTSLRGKVIPVIDLKKKLLLGGDDAEESSKKILILNGPKGSIGALVDSVMDVIRFSESSIVPPPGHLTEAQQKFIEGVTVHGNLFLSIIRTNEALNFRVLTEE